MMMMPLQWLVRHRHGVDLLWQGRHVLLMAQDLRLLLLGLLVLRSDHVERWVEISNSRVETMMGRQEVLRRLHVLAAWDQARLLLQREGVHEHWHHACRREYGRVWR